MKATIKIDKKEQDKLVKFIITQIADQMIDRITHSMGEIKINVESYIRTQFFASPAVHSLTEEHGKLRGDLGLDKSIGNKMQKILETILSNIKIDPPTKAVFGKYVRITYLWRILPMGYHDVLGLDISSYISEKSGEEIPWLSWLLQGTPGISGYFVANWTEGDLGESRSGIAIMWKGQGRSWSMPVGFAGTEVDNFLTKIFDEIGMVIAKEVGRVIGA